YQSRLRPGPASRPRRLPPAAGRAVRPRLPDRPVRAVIIRPHRRRGVAPMSNLSELSTRVAARFHDAFGRTPLAERVQDILAQATPLGRFADVDNLKDATGDLLCSVLQLFTECGWDPAALAEATLAKIEDRKDIYARLGRKLRVALLGGAFDPVHRGHLEV